MMSPQGYLSEILIQNLKNWCENVSDESVKVGILSQNVRLSNLVLREQSWPISKEWKICLKHGTLGLFSLQFPLSTIHMGCLNIEVDDIHIVLSIEPNDAMNSPLSNMEQLKPILMREVQSLNQRAESNKQPSSWLGSYLKIFTQTLLAKFAANSTVTAHNINVSVLLPQPSDHCVHFKFCIQSIILLPKSKREADMKSDGGSMGKMECFLGKDISICNISFQLQYIDSPKSVEDLELLGSKQFDTQYKDSIVLNSTTISMQIWCKKLRGSPFSISSIRALVLEASSQNMEWTPSKLQLLALNGVVPYLSIQAIKLKVLYYYNNSIGKRLKGMALFKFLGEVIIAINRFRTKGLCAAVLFYDIYKLSREKVYSKLYNRILQSRLANFEAYRAKTSENSTLDFYQRQFEGSGLSEAEQQQFSSLSLSINYDEQFQLRELVHKKMLDSENIDSNNLIAAVLNNPRPKNWLRLYYSDSSSTYSAANSVHSAVIDGYKKEEEAAPLIFEMSICISRLSVSLMEPIISSHQDANITKKCQLENVYLSRWKHYSGVDNKSSLSLVVYGIHAATEIESDNLKSIQLSLGVVKLYGFEGEELLLCGDDSVDWLDMDSIRTGEYKVNDRAFHAKYRTILLSDGQRIDVNEYNALQMNGSNDGNATQHRQDAVLTIFIGYLQMKFSPRSVTFIRQLIDAMPKPVSIAQKPLAVYREKIAAFVDQEKFHTRRAKWNLRLDALMRGASLSIPFGRSGSSHHSAIRETQNFDKTAVNNSAPIDLSKHYLQLSIGEISIIYDDDHFVKPVQVEEKPKPVRIIGLSAKVSAPNTPKTSDLKSSVVSAQPDDSHEVNKFSKKLLSKIESVEGQSIRFSVTDISLLYVERGELFQPPESSKHGLESVVSEPWSICGAFFLGASFQSLSSQSPIPDDQIFNGDLFFIDASALICNISSQSILDIQSVCHEVEATVGLGASQESVGSSEYQDSNVIENPYSFIQFVALADKPVLSLDLCCDGLTVNLFEVNSQMDTKQEILQNIITSYCESLQMLGNKTFVKAVKKNLCLRQLLNMGMDKVYAETILSQSEINVKSEDLSTSFDWMHNIIHSDYCSALLMENTESTERFKAIICSMSITSLCVHSYNLIYDNVSIISLDSILLHDSHYCPMFFIERSSYESSKSDVDRSKRKDPPPKSKAESNLRKLSVSLSDRDKACVGYLIDKFDNASSGLKIYHISKDFGNNFGVGGFKMEDVRKNAQIHEFISLRHHEIESFSDCLEVFYSSTVAVQLLEKISTTIKHLESNNRGPSSRKACSPDTADTVRHKLHHKSVVNRNTQPMHMLDSHNGSRYKQFESPTCRPVQGHLPVVTVNVNMQSCKVTLATDDNSFVLQLSIQNCCMKIEDVLKSKQIRTSEFRIQKLELFDLTPLGTMHHEVIWSKRHGKKSEKFASSSSETTSPVLEGTCREYLVQNKSKDINVNGIDLVGTVNYLRVCFLYRFIIDIVNFITVHIVGPKSRNANQISVEEVPGIESRSVLGDSELESGTSDSSDNESEESRQLYNKSTSYSFLSNNSDRPVLEKRTLHDNLNRFHISSPVPTPPSAASTNKETPKNNSSSIAFKFLFIVNDLTAYGPRNSNSRDCVGVNVETVTVKISQESHPWMAPTETELTPQGAIDGNGSHCLYFDTDTNTWKFSTHSEDNAANGNEEFNFINNVLRISLIASSVDAFVSLSQPLRRSSMEKQSSNHPDVTHHAEEELQYLEIFDRESVYEIQKPLSNSNIRKHSPHSSQSWQKISSDPFNFRMVLDFTSDQVKLLFSDDEVFSQLNFEIAQSELYLIIAIWSENVCECSQISLGAVSENLQTNPLLHSLSELETSYSAYGSKRYCDFLMHRKDWFELLITRQAVTAKCAIDTNYFPRNIPSNECLASSKEINRSDWPSSTSSKQTIISPSKAQPLRRKFSFISGKEWKSRLKPIADIECSSFLLHLKMDYDCIQMSLSAGDVAIKDLRDPAKSLRDVVFSVHQGISGTAKAGYCSSDFQYGFNLLPSSVIDNSKRSHPFQMSLISSSISNWMTINIGLDSCNLNVLNMDMVWLISEYVSCYFRFSEYGHPALTAFEKLRKDIIPYGGIDTRLFVTNPHVTLIRNPLQMNSEVLQLETNKGVFFRYALDTTASVKMELNLYDVAVVLVRRYQIPEKARGLRGASGSGRGIRTLLEYFSLKLLYHFEAEDNHLDVKLDCSGHSDETRNHQFNSGVGTACVDLNAEELRLKPGKVFNPTCLISHIMLSTKFRPDSSDIVTCYEDLILCKELFTTFLGMKAQESKIVNECESKKCSVFMVISVTGVRVMIVDNVLGLHLPLIQLFVDNVNTTLFRAKGIEVSTEVTENQSAAMKNIGFSFSKSQSIYVNIPIDQVETPNNDGAGLFAGFASQANQERQSKSASSSKVVIKYPVSLLVDSIFSMEYFNNLKKCWEPLLNKLYTTVMLENSDNRGHGYSINFHNAVHFNLSGALIRTLNDLLRTTQLAETGSTEHNAGEGEEVGGAYNNELSNSWSKHHSSGSQLWKAGDRSSSILLDEMNLAAIESDNQNQFTSNTLDASKTISHLKSSALDPAFRVGFSVYNLTGQGIRYLQIWEGGRITIQYLNDKERGLLNFISSMSSIRNGTLVEVPFDVQLEKGDRKQFRNRKKAVGNRVALQVSGFDWLRSVQADELGMQFYDVMPVLGRRFEDKNSLIVKNALKLVAEVVPYCGGRMLRLRSVFSIKNKTEHSLNIKIQDDGTDSVGNEVELNEFKLESNGIFFVPVSLLYRSIRSNDSSKNGDFLGSIKIRPADLPPIMNGLQKNSIDLHPSSVDYSTDPINLYQNIVGTTQDPNGDDFGAQHRGLMQLRCDVKSQLDSKSVPRAFNMKTFRVDTDRYHSMPKFPPICYNVEIIRETSSTAAASDVSNAQRENHVDKTNILTTFFPASTKDSKDFTESPKCYTIVIHPPIVLENLLPVDAIFEILHATHKTVLWSSQLRSEDVVPIHTVTLDQPLSLMIKAKYCCTSEGIIFHESNTRQQQKKHKKVGNWRNDLEPEILDVILSDTVGQRLRVHVENIEGGGGQRHLIVFCPFLILNTSQYSFRVREEGHTSLPAGTVSEKKDGSREMPGSNITAHSEFNTHHDYNVAMKSIVQDRLVRTANSHYDLASSVSSSNDHNEHFIPPSAVSKVVEHGRTFPGKIGAFHSNSKLEVSMDWRKHHFLEELTFEEIKNYSYMFNYTEASSYILGGRKVKIQLDDSNWSSPFSLDSIGVNQVISINHKTGCYEAGFNIIVAPGRMSKYTKIVRFLPHYTIVNKLSTSVRVFQPCGFAGQDLESEVSAGSIRPYHLPSVNGQRNIGFKLEGPWNSTAAFPIDQVGTYIMSIRRQLPAVHHVNTRGETVYTVPIPKECSKLGLWLETDWGAESILVKRIKPGSYASNCTKIHVGDVLIAINDLDVTKKSFSEVMEEFNKISSRENNFLKFRTLEERLKLIREMANNKSSVKKANTSVENISTTLKKTMDGSSKDQRTLDEYKLLKVEFRQFESSVAIKVDEVTDDSIVEYRIDNKSWCYVIYYKQKGIVGNKWYTLYPGQTAPFAWEDPFRPHKLSIIVGHNVLTPHFSPDMISSSSLSLFSADQNSAFFEFDSINSTHTIPIQFRDPKHPKALQGTVKSVGHCKILEITPNREKDHFLAELDYCHRFCGDQINAIENFLDQIVDTIRNSYEKDEMEATEAIIEIKSKQQEICKVLEEDFLFKQVEEALTKEDPEKLDDAKFTAVEKLQLEELAKLGCTEMNQLSILDLRNLEAFVETHKNTEILKILAPETFKNIEQEAKVRYDATLLVSYIPFEKVLESGLTAKNQLIVNVLEARDLTPTVVGKVEDVYCKVYLVLRNSSVPNIFRSWKRAYRTYICDQTMDPSWLYQNFLLELPANGNIDSRQLFIRVDVLAKSSIGFDQVLGRADIQLSTLENEKELSGWFPLRYNSNSALLNEGGHAESMTGSIKLSLQWIHSRKGLTDHYFEASYRRLLELQLYQKILNFSNDFHRKTDNFKFSEQKVKENKYFKKDNYYTMHFRHLKNLTADEYLEKRLAETSIPRPMDNNRHSLRVNFSVDQTYHNINFTLFPLSPSFPERVRRDSISLSKDNVKLRSESQCSALETVSKMKKSKAKFGLLDNYLPASRYFESTPLPDVSFTHEKAYQNWAEQFTGKYKYIHESMKKFMMRSNETVEEGVVFARRFDEECNKTFLSLHMFDGKVEVTPLQAQNLPDSRNAVFVRISYGEEKFDSISMPPASFLSWHQESMDDNFSHYASNLKGGESKQKFTSTGSGTENTFQVNALNIKGKIKVRILAEGFPKATTLAEVNIPVFNLLQCICDGKEYYERWFPLTTYDDIAVGEGELEKLYSSYATEQISTSNLGYKPCINLRIRWVNSESSDKDTPPLVSKMYSRFQVPAVTVAVIDSERAAELLQVSLLGLEMRRTVTDLTTNTNINITWVQVDNELPDTEAPVIMCPTFQKYPQPVLRLHFLEKNNLDQKNSKSYHSIQLCIQELDLKLEQQTVVASWDLLKSWLDHEGNILYSESEIISKSSSGNGYHSRGELAKENLLSDGLKLWESYGDFLNRKSNVDSNYEDKKISAEEFVINPVKLNVSFITSPHVLSKKISTRQQSVDIRNQGIIGLYSTLSMFIWQVGEVILSLTSTISNTSIQFTGFVIDNMFNKSVSEIQKTLQDHYINSAWRQLYKIVGSLELVGVNPIGLLSSLSIGVVSFFYEPAHAIITSPTEFRKIGKGVFKGTVSLVSNVSVGLLGTSIGVTQSASRIASKVTMDATYMSAREKLQRPPRTLGGVITRPMKDIGTGIYYASTGLVKFPYSGYVNQGIPGLVKGAGKGLGGALTKPMVGIFDACSHSFSGAKDLIDVITINSARPVPRLRLSDLFGPDGRILPYNYANSLGAYLLQLLDQSNEEEFVSTAIHDGMGVLNMCGTVFSLPPVKSTPPEPSNSSLLNRRSARRYSTVTRPVRNFSRQEGKPYKTTQKTDEYVISTSLFRDSEKHDKAVVITTSRVVVMDYRRQNLRSTFNALWECPMHYLATPELRIISSEVQLTFKLLNPSLEEPSWSEFFGRAIHFSQTKKLSDHHEFTLTCNESEEEVLFNMENTINVMSRNCERVSDRKILLNHNASTLCEKVEEGRVDIGAWQYIDEEKYYSNTAIQLQQDFSREGLNYEIYEQLGLEPWKMSSIMQSNVPNWLEEERHDAEAAHSNQQRYYTACESIRNLTFDSAKLVENFECGLLKPDEFLNQASRFGNCYESFESNTETTSKCSEFDGRNKKKVAWSIGRSVLSFAVHSGQSINSNISKIVSRKAKANYKGSQLVSDHYGLEDTTNERTDIPTSYLGSDKKERLPGVQVYDEICDDESFSTVASSMKGVPEKREINTAPKSILLSDKLELREFHRDDSLLKASEEVPSNTISSDGEYAKSGDFLSLPIVPQPENLHIETLELQEVKMTNETRPHLARVQLFAGMHKQSSLAPRQVNDMHTSHVHAHHRRPSGLLAEVNPMMASKLPPHPVKKEEVADSIASPGRGFSKEMTYDDIYSSLQVVNGVVTTPPSRLVDAVAAPVDSTNLTILLLNERINRLENIILSLHPTSTAASVPSSATWNDPPQSSQVLARALQFSESSDALFDSHHEESHFDYLVDSMPHSSSLDPTFISPHFTELSTSSDAPEEITQTSSSLRI